MRIISLITTVLILILPNLLNAQCVSGDCDNGRGIYMYPSGAKYIGDFKEGEIHGVGTCHYTDGSKYQGQWIYRYPEGNGIKTYADGTTWKGQWKKGKPVDEGGSFIEESMVSKGEVQNDGTDIQSGCISGDCKNGMGTFAYPDGSKYQGQFARGQINGWGTWYYSNGDKYIGSFVNSYAHGKGTVYHKDNSRTTGEWKDGEFIGNSLIEKGRKGCIEGDCANGRGTYIYQDGVAKYVGTFRNGRPHGKGACYFSNGERYSGEWATGSFEGIGTLLLKDGREVTGLWKAGTFVRKENTSIAATKPQTQSQSQPKPSTSTTSTYTSNTKPTSTASVGSTNMKVWAVVIGVASYNHMPALRYTDDDAYRMYAFLKSPEGGALSDERIKILIDEDATREKIIATLKNVFNKAGSNDLVMMYFSGHGLRGSFLPIDYDGFNNKILHDEINDIFRQSKARYKLCIADACHSGSLLAARSASAKSVLTNYYKTLAQAQPGTALIMSSKSEETSLESSGLRQGVFSHFLIRGLKGEADANGNNIVTVEELFNYLNTTVTTYTGYQQTPVIKGDYDRQMTVAVRR